MISQSEKLIYLSFEEQQPKSTKFVWIRDVT